VYKMGDKHTLSYQCCTLDKKKWH